MARIDYRAVVVKDYTGETRFAQSTYKGGQCVPPAIKLAGRCLAIAAA